MISERCAAQIADFTGFHWRSCERNAKHHEPDTDGQIKGWCTQHTPSLVRARREARNQEYGAKRARRAQQTRLEAAAPALLAAARDALSHIEELEEAWRRGVLHELDTPGGTRSNKNVDVRVALEAAIKKAEGAKHEPHNLP